MRILHITNGDGAAGILKASTVSGDVLPWRDPMHHGPFPAGLSLDDLRPVRSRYLAGPGGSARAVERDFRLRDDHLRATPKYDGVVLWFEHDLLDQLQILQLLDWFATADVNGATLEIICIDRFPGMPQFRGLGELDPVQMASLFDKRVPVTREMLEQAQTGWAAFRSVDPRNLVGFMRGDLTSLPFLRAALARHLEEFPSTQTGLNRTERQLLCLIAEGCHSPVDLFLRNMTFETALFIGDWSTYSILDRLCQAGLIAGETGAFWSPPKSRDDRPAFGDQRLVLTDQGQQVLSGEIDASRILIRDDWLGGVHIQSDKPHWTWDGERAEPVLRTPG